MITEVFSDGGALVTALKRAGRSATMRPSQRQYAECVERAMASGQPAFLDAETGVGKTLGYLVPTMLAAFGSPQKRALVVVSTATVSLQRQIVEEDIPIALAVVREKLGVHARAEMRVGREQVVDPARLAIAISELADTQDLALASDIASWVGDRIAGSELPLRTDLMEAFADRLMSHKNWLAPSTIGLEGGGSGDADLLYEALLERCAEADVLVVNHHLLAINMLRRFLWAEDRGVFLVVDEADRLPDIVESINRRMLPLHALSHTIGTFQGVEEAKGAADALVMEAGEHFANAWMSVGGAVTPLSRLDRAERLSLAAKMKDAAKAIETALARLKRKAKGQTAGYRERLSYLDHASRELAALNTEMEGQNGSALLYYSPVRKYPGIASVRPGSARMIAKSLWKDSPFEMKSLVFTSATLGTMASHTSGIDVKRALTPFITECGFAVAEIDASACAIISPDEFGQMEFVRPKIDAPSPFEGSSDDLSEVSLRPEAVAIWRRMIEQASSRGGRTLVLVPSYRDVTTLAGSLDGLGERLVVQRAGLPTGAAISLFLSQPDSLWLSASAWEGVSLPGAISHIVIPRFPIRPSVLEDNILERYFEELGVAAKGRSIVFGRKMAEARRRLRQGIGRGIRADDDSVTIWIGDSRWPFSQDELDRTLADQPTTWSSTMLNSVPKRFRKKVETSPRMA